MACISNDPSFELNPNLGKSINLDAFEPMLQISSENNISRFIYASSSSVYGVKIEKNVTEDMTLEPLTDYSQFKADCEKILDKFSSNQMTTVTIRPATVCGYSPRQRLDVVVNILTNLAYHKREITIFGGNQLRPNIHIDDMVNAYICLINAEKKIINGQIFNAGYENQKVKDIAEIVKNNVGNDVQLKVEDTDDNRSYHISSEKIFNSLNFKSVKTIDDAVKDLIYAFDKNILVNSLDNENYFNIKKMQNINLV